MRGRQSACCFTGHRPGKLPWRYNEEDLRCVSLKARIADAVEAAYQEGFRHFLCGMALGCDLYFCECVLRLRSGGFADECRCVAARSGFLRDRREIRTVYRIRPMSLPGGCLAAGPAAAV